jgi:hypothetical protein
MYQCTSDYLSVSMIFTFLFPFASMSLSSLSVVIDCTASLSVVIDCTALLWGNQATGKLNHHLVCYLK